MVKYGMKVWSMYSLLVVFLLAMVGFGVYSYLYIPVVATEKEQVATVLMTEKKNLTKDDAWQLIYPGAEKMKIKDLVVDVSVARTWPERIKGLSDTPYLPDNLVKLFIFDSPALHSIWMKDMQYSIDILWVDSNNKIIHIEENVAPASYPNIFLPEEPALYVIEAVSGFVSKNKIGLGDSIILPL